MCAPEGTVGSRFSALIDLGPSIGSAAFWAVLGAVGCCAASLAPTHTMPGAPLVMTTTDAPRWHPVSLGVTWPQGRPPVVKETVVFSFKNHILSKLSPDLGVVAKSFTVLILRGGGGGGGESHLFLGGSLVRPLTTEADFESGIKSSTPVIGRCQSVQSAS